MKSARLHSIVWQAFKSLGLAALSCVCVQMYLIRVWQALLHEALERLYETRIGIAASANNT